MMALALLGAPAPALAGDEAESFGGVSSLLLDAGTVYQSEETAKVEAPKPSPRFGEAGHWGWEISGAAAFGDDWTHLGLAWDAGVFLADSFELTFGAAGWAFLQDEQDEAGINPRFGFRWHFLQRERFTVYAEAGIGLLLSTGDVPEGGESFNFTPRAGIGSTIAVGESGNRLDVGVRWHHISTASTSGSDDNPALDGIEIYLGFIVPF